MSATTSDTRAAPLAVVAVTYVKGLDHVVWHRVYRINKRPSVT